MNTNIKNLNKLCFVPMARGVLLRSLFYKYFVTLALIFSNQPKRLIGTCSGGAKYL